MNIKPHLIDFQIIYNCIKREINNDSIYSKCKEFYEMIVNHREYFSLDHINFKDYIYEEYKEEHNKTKNGT